MTFDWGKKFNLHCPDVLPGLRYQVSTDQYKDSWRLPRSALSTIYGQLDHETRYWTESWIRSIEYLHDSMLGRVRRGTFKIVGRPLPVASILEGRMDEDFFLPFLKQELRTTREPVFLWIHANVPHPPFHPSPPYFGRFDGSPQNWSQLSEAALDSHPGYDHLPEATLNDPDHREIVRMLRARYDEHILYMDAGVAEAVEIIRGLELLNPFVLIISADHGALVPNFFPDAKEEEAYHIPLIICAPGQVEGQRIGSPGGTLDFAPTILDLIGVTPPEWMEGKSLVRFMEGDK